MNDTKPPIVKVRRSKLNTTEFSSNFLNNTNTSNNFYFKSFSNNFNKRDEISPLNHRKFDDSVSTVVLDKTFENSNETSSDYNNKDTDDTHNKFSFDQESLDRTEYIEESNAKSKNSNSSVKSIYLPSESPSPHRRAPVPAPTITPRKHLHDPSNNFNEANGSKYNSEKNNPFIVRNTSQTFTRDDQDTITPRSNSGEFLRSIFSYEGKSIDLELDGNVLRWKPISEKSKSKRKSAEVEISLNKFYGIEPQFFKSKANTSRSKNGSNGSTPDLSSNDEIFINGFLLHMFDSEKPNLFKHKTLSFQHPHRETCKEWISKISDLIPTLQNEREIIIFINPYSGQKNVRSILNHSVIPLLKTAQLKYSVYEFHDRVSLSDLLYKNNFHLNDYYGIVVMAGDGGVSKFINLMIEYEANQQHNSSICEIEELKSKLLTPLCIIPCGSTNMIANSIYGTNDLVTPLMYLFYGLTIRIDLSSAFTNVDKLHSFGFGYSCGFGTTINRYLNRYSRLGNNKVQTSLTRGVAKQKHKPIEVEIHYLRNKAHQPNDENLCTRGCKICGNMEKNIKLKKTIDTVEDFDPIESSLEEIKHNLSNTTNKYKRNDYSEWEIIRGSFIHIAFLTNATLWDQSPGGGLSKYGHLADGCIDLVLVDPVPRKEFYRFIKRHTNRKNQLALPFVKTVRIKEAKIKILNAENSISNSAFTDDSINSFNMNDLDYSSPTKINHFQFNKSDKENAKPPMSLSKSYHMDFKSGAESDENYVPSDSGNSTRVNSRVNSVKSNQKGPKVYYIKNNSQIRKENVSSENGAFENDDHRNQPDNRSISLSSKNSFMRKSQSILNLFKMDNSKSKKGNNLNGSMNGSILNLNNTSGNDTKGNEYQKNRFSGYPGKFNNFTSSSSFKSPSVWNCDWNLNNIPEMHIKCNKQFLPVFACGIDPQTEYEDASVALCFPGFN